VKVGSRCRLLELPPGQLTHPQQGMNDNANMDAELRNRMYDFTKEMEFEPCFPPPLFTRIKPDMKGRPPYSRAFFALTQTCKQLRLEFRPLWLRDSSVQLKFDDIVPFVATFYPLVAEYDNAPKLLVISWHHDYEERDSDLDDVLFDITPLLRLRAFCSTSVVKFVPHRLNECDLPNVDCGHSIHCGCDAEGCDHDDAMEEAFEILNGIYEHTDALDEVLANKNEAWLKALRDTSYSKSLKVQVTVTMGEADIVIYIHFRPAVESAYYMKKTLYDDAVKFLHGAGLLDLEHGDTISFFVGGETGNYARHSQHCSHGTPIYEQMEIWGKTVYKPETAAGLKVSPKALHD
jgi:hypothetical protein